MNDYQKVQEKISRKYTNEIQELKFQIDRLYRKIEDLQIENNCLADENRDLKEKLDIMIDYRGINNQDLKILIKEAKTKKLMGESFDLFLRNLGGFKY